MLGILIFFVYAFIRQPEMSKTFPVTSSEDICVIFNCKFFLIKSLCSFMLITGKKYFLKFLCVFGSVRDFKRYNCI